MIPKEEAEELVSRMHNCGGYGFEIEYAIDCALIAVDMIEQAIDWHEFETPNKEIEYWKEVENELLKMKV